MAGISQEVGVAIGNSVGRFVVFDRANPTITEEQIRVRNADQVLLVPVQAGRTISAAATLTMLSRF